MKYFNEGQGKMCKALSIRIKQKAIKNEYTGKKTLASSVGPS